jgi:S-DNA-T family DNA segregation ATPase FtsK/SpoIIIE
MQKASTSLLQRKFRIGYNKAARIIDELEANGIIGPQMGSKPREVYIKSYSEEDEN